MVYRTLTLNWFFSKRKNLQGQIAFSDKAVLPRINLKCVPKHRGLDILSQPFFLWSFRNWQKIKFSEYQNFAVTNHISCLIDCLISQRVFPPESIDLQQQMGGRRDYCSNAFCIFHQTAVSSVTQHRVAKCLTE